MSKFQPPTWSENKTIASKTHGIDCMLMEILGNAFMCPKILGNRMGPT